MKKKSEKEYIYVRITESLYCTLETNTTFLINYTSIKITEIKKKKLPLSVYIRRRADLEKWGHSWKLTEVSSASWCIHLTPRCVLWDLLCKDTEPRLWVRQVDETSGESWEGNMQEQMKSLAAVRLWNIAIPQWRDDVDT